MGWKKQRRMSRSAAVYIPLGALIIVLLVIFGTSGFLRVTEIVVNGATKYSDDDVVAFSGISPGDNLLFLDVRAAGRRIQVALPYISTARVTRVPPDKIRIEVRESTAIASLGFRDEFLLIDSTGRVLERTETASADLIEVLGINPSEVDEGSQLRVAQGGEMQLQYMLDVLSAIERTGIQDDVSYLDVSTIAEISFGYLERFKVVLDSLNNLRQNLGSLQRAIERLEERDSAITTGTWRPEADGDWRWIPDY